MGGEIHSPSLKVSRNSHLVSCVAKPVKFTSQNQLRRFPRFGHRPPATLARWTVTLHL